MIFLKCDTLRSETKHSLEIKSPKIKKFHEGLTPNTSKVPFLPLLSIRTNAIEEMYKEIKELKSVITELEEKNKVNSRCIEIGKVKIKELEARQARLKIKAGLGSTDDERKEELSNKLKKLQSSWKKNSIKMKQKITEFEEEIKLLSIKADSIRNLLFRKGQQHRFLKKSLSDSGSHSESGSQSCEFLNSSGQLRTILYAPSLSILHY
ncbi:hypothetical protein SteCoe_5319 [Stentor coeruleus]|uniref:Uncharacterized protein n=1 Tax=Stentor coeruleus TaxID=5963 RepID=A0A1R2CSL5_9CILI|nr:hypothetical protein SteCoe_5319 [Stentor coeruleus]